MTPLIFADSDRAGEGMGGALGAPEAHQGARAPAAAEGEAQGAQGTAASGGRIAGGGETNDMEGEEVATTAERVQEVALAQVELRGSQAVLATRLDHVAEKVEVIDARGERLEARSRELDEGQRKQGEQLAGVAEATGRIPVIVEAQATQGAKLDQVIKLLQEGQGGNTGPLTLAAAPKTDLLGVALKSLGPTGVTIVLLYLLLSGKISL